MHKFPNIYNLLSHKVGVLKCRNIECHSQIIGIWDYKNLVSQIYVVLQRLDGIACISRIWLQPGNQKDSPDSTGTYN